MKKIIISLVALAFAFQLNAQSKAETSALKAVNKAKAETANPKKSGSSASWIKLGNAYVDAYDAPTLGLFQNAPQTQVKLLLREQQLLSSGKEEINGAVFSTDTYANKVLYYDEAGTLLAWVVKTPVVEGDALKLGYDAYLKAVELDNGKENKGTVDGLASLQAKYLTEGMNHYTLGEYKEASLDFEKSWEISVNPLINKLDSTMAYYAAATATMAADSERAIKLLEYCKSIDYVKDGEVYASLSESYKAAGDTVKAKAVLTEGFTAYPSNQSILVSLINIYLETNDSPEKVLEVLKAAQANEPTNASLYYAEGNIYKNLNKFDEAIACYKKSSEIDPTYFYAPFSEGDALYSKAIDIQTKAQAELDDAKFNALNAQMEEALESALVPFEKAFAITEEVKLKAGCAEYLKQIYFRFREKNPEYMAAYEKYNEYLQNN